MSATSFDRICHLTKADVHLSGSYFEFFEKWSRTRQQIQQDRWISVPRVVGSMLCLNSTLTSLLRVSPTTSRTQPFLLFRDGNPIPVSYMPGARYMQRAGVLSSDIASHGGWKSMAIYRYFHNPTKPAAFKALRDLK